MKVIIDEKEYDMDRGPFNLELTWKRTAGWRLWAMEDPPFLIGGQHDSEFFQIWDGKQLLYSNVPGTKRFKVTV